MDILVQSRRNKKAAKRFFRKLLKGMHYVPWVIITDKLASYGAAKREIVPSVEHRQHKRLNKRILTNPHPYATARAKNALLQIGGSCPTLSLCLWSHLQSFSSAKALHESSGVPCHFTEPIPRLERGDWGQTSRIRITLPRSPIALEHLFFLELINTLCTYQ